MQIARYLYLEFLNYIHMLQLSLLHLQCLVWYRDAILITAKIYSVKHMS
jgi:hypothetical protein